MNREVLGTRMVGIRENGNPTAAEPLTAFYLGVAMTEGLSTITAVERRTCTAALTGSENRKIRTAYLLLGVYLVPRYTVRTHTSEITYFTYVLTQ